MIIVCPRMPAPPSFVRAMLFLRPSPTGYYELVGSHAGLIPIERQDGTPADANLPALVSRIRSLRAAGRPNDR